MTPQIQRLLDEALLLPERDRLKIAAELLSSVDGPPSLDRDDWETEIVRRAEAALAGSPGVPWEEDQNCMAKLATELAQDPRAFGQLTPEEQRARLKKIRGIGRGALTSSEEFARQKVLEIEIEDRKLRS